MKAVLLNEYKIFSSDINEIAIEDGQKVINTINAHSYIVAKSDPSFNNALKESDILLPDGEGVVLMVKKLKGQNIKKIAGADIHDYLLEVSNQKGLRCFYIGSSQNTLDLIDKTLSEKYKNITFGFFSPPFKKEFSEEDSNFMISKINAFKPNVVFVGMTAPKQEKWVNANKDKIDANIICSIGAVFDFVAGTIKRAPQWVIDLRLEWLYRSFTGTRLAKRYLYSTPLFLIEVFKLKYFGRHKKNA